MPHVKIEMTCDRKAHSGSMSSNKYLVANCLLWSIASVAILFKYRSICAFILGRNSNQRLVENNNILVVVLYQT